MTRSAEAYVDTSTLVAFVDRFDPFHHLSVLYPIRHPPVIDSYRGLDAMVGAMQPLKIIAIANEDLNLGKAVLRRFSDQELTLVDAVGLHVMATRRIRSCWSTDFHLSLTGVPLLIHS
jgi:predicted nucleic acid-binding protein